MFSSFPYPPFSDHGPEHGPPAAGSGYRRPRGQEIGGPGQDKPAAPNRRRSKQATGGPRQKGWRYGHYSFTRELIAVESFMLGTMLK